MPRTVRMSPFTRLDLLVVVALVLAAAAWLIPLLHQYRYDARLVACAGNLRGIGLAVNVYADDADGCYPQRRAANVATYATPNLLVAGPADDRVRLRAYLPIDSLQCPFSVIDGVSLETSIAARVESSYDLYFGYRLVRGDPATGLMRLGEPARYGGRTFRVVAADMDHSYAGFPRRARYSAQPDHDGFLRPCRFQTHERSASCWVSSRGNLRGGVDRQFLLADFSVRCLRNTLMVDPRLVAVPLLADHPNRRAYAYLPAD